MIQFYKFFSLVIRVFTKPLVTYTKQYHLSQKQFSHQRLRIFFVFLGNKFNYFESAINRNNLKNASSEVEKIKPLTEEVAYNSYEQ